MWFFSSFQDLFFTYIFIRPSWDEAKLCDWVWLATGGRPHRVLHNNFCFVYRIFSKLGHMIPLWKGKNPIYFGVITIIPFDNLYRRAYFVMHTFLVFLGHCIVSYSIVFWLPLWKLFFLIITLFRNCQFQTSIYLIDVINKLICNAYTGKDTYIYLQMFKEYLYKYILLTLKTIYTHIK